MESLLSLSFTNLSSKDFAKIRKGLRQIEGLLAQICLPPASSPTRARRGSVQTHLEPPPAHGRRGSVQTNGGGNSSGEENGQNIATDSTKGLKEMAQDPAFLEWYRLQESFQWNVATRLITLLNHLLSQPTASLIDTLLTSTLSLLHGILLLHPPSRTHFSLPDHMMILLDLLDPFSNPQIQSSTLLVLVTTMLGNPTCLRTFEECEGLWSITSMMHSDTIPKGVKVKCIEFLYFYLMPETPHPTRPTSSSGGSSRPTSSSSNASSSVENWQLQRSPSKIVKALAERRARPGSSGSDREEKNTRNTEEKQHLLARYLSNVDELVQDLKETQPYSEWMVD